MTLHAEISLYPLSTSDITQDIVSFLNHIESRGLTIEWGRMSSIASGESELLFSAIREAFDQCCDTTKAVLCMKVSNAVPPAA